MKKVITTFFCVIIVLGIYNSVKAQITLQESDFSQLEGKTFTVINYSTSNSQEIQPIASLTGANQLFDFTTISSFSQGDTATIRIQKMSPDLPGAKDTVLSKANFVMIEFSGTNTQSPDSSVYIYSKLTSDGLYTLGGLYITSYDVNNDGVSPDTVKIPTISSPELFKLPLTYGAAWRDTASTSYSFMGYTSKQTTIFSFKVDGYGTLKTPDYSDQCLRIVEVDTTLSSVEGITDTTVSKNVQMITKNNPFASANISFDSNGNASSADYTVVNGMTTPIEKSPVSSIARKFQLNQNYPNPFNPTTIISYDLNKAGNIKLDIFNTLGQKVATLVNGKQSAGAHRVSFDASYLNSGVYFYKLTSCNLTKTRNMILIK